MSSPSDCPLPDEPGSAEPSGDDAGRGRALRNAPEVAIFAIGVLAWAAILCWAGCLWHFGQAGRARALLSTVAVHVTAGRAMGVSMALSLEFARSEAILLASLVETGVVCVFYSIFLFSARRLIQVPWLDNAFNNVRRTAAEHRSRLTRWGVPGLFLFVWFPFFMTGPVVGSVIGFLLGLQPYVTIGVVLAGTFTAIIFWTLAIGPVVHWASRVGQTIPMMIVMLLCVFIVANRLRQNARERRNQASGDAPDGNASDGTTGPRPEHE